MTTAVKISIPDHVLVKPETGRLIPVSQDGRFSDEVIIKFHT